VARPRNAIGNPSAAQIVALDDNMIAKRYRTLSMYLMASEPDTIAASISSAILTERRRLDATSAPIPDKLAALERWLDERDLLDGATAFVDRHRGSAHRIVNERGTRR
jgi:hypothetical protein